MKNNGLFLCILIATLIVACTGQDDKQNIEDYPGAELVLLNSPEGYTRDVTCSNDMHICVLAMGQSGKEGPTFPLYLVEPHHNLSKELHSEGYNPLLSPAGKYLAYEERILRIVDMEGKTIREFRNQFSSRPYTDWSVDEKLIIFAQDLEDKQPFIYAYDIENDSLEIIAEIQMFSAKSLGSGAISPDNRYIAFVLNYSTKVPREKQGDIFMLDRQNNTTKQLIYTPDINEDDLDWIDSRTLVFISKNPSVSWGYLSMLNLETNCALHFEDYDDVERVDVIRVQNQNRLLVMSLGGDSFILRVPLPEC